MNIQRRVVRSGLFLLAVFAVIGAYPPSVNAQGASKAPVIDQFDVESEDRLVAGSRLRFTVEGTAKATASVRISGIKQRIPLKEVEEGVYEGSYTVKAGDRITADSTARATLKQRNRSTSAVLQESLGVTVLIADVPSPNVLAIESFTATPIEKIEPGADLEFALIGTPGGQASVSIEGLAGSVALREVKSGHYQGSYTIRRADRISADARVSGILVVGGKTLRTSLNHALTAVAKRPSIRNLLPRDGDTVAAGNLISVSGTFDDSSGGGIDPKSVKLLVSGKNVTPNTVITSQFFNYQADLAAGTHTAAVTAKDYAGNAVNQTWTFKVSGQAGAASALPLEILSHQNNAQIGPDLTEIRGRTAPDATIDIQAVAVSAIFGIFGVSQPEPGQSTRADANGNFAFRFQPQTVARGTRYEITLTASKNGLSQVARLKLMQKQ